MLIWACPGKIAPYTSAIYLIYTRLNLLWCEPGKRSDLDKKDRRVVSSLAASLDTGLRTTGLEASLISSSCASDKPSYFSPPVSSCISFNEGDRATCYPQLQSNDSPSWVRCPQYGIHEQLPLSGAPGLLLRREDTGANGSGWQILKK